MRFTTTLALFAVSLLCAQSIIAQQDELFIPREIQRTYEEQTRSKDGKPGPNYWQNTVDYDIDVSVDPAERILSGTAAIEYFNNSPDDLTRIVLRLYGNVLKKGGIRDDAASPDEVHDGVEVAALKVNGTEIDLGNRRQARTVGTNMYVFLPEALTSGESMSIEVDWSQNISNRDGRQGFADSTSAFVAYWYPQMAVYDDIYGWDNLQYTYQAEFYNELANFDVSIEIPENYTVWATGVMQNPDAVLPSAKLEMFNEAKESDETVQILTEDEAASGFEYKSGKWEFKADEVTDFAFAFSDHFAWGASSQLVDGERVLIHAAYPTNGRADYSEIVQMHRKIMRHLSEDVPGIPYPYPTFTAYIGLRGGGMEFPMMANNDGPGTRVSIHEMFHTYFPMYVRVNERRHAWMDEGWADFSDALVAYRHFGDNELPINAEFSDRVRGTIGTGSDLPLITQTRYLDGSNYGYASYPLPAMVFWLLYDELGDEVFFNCLRTYIREWAMKSPSPYDLFYTFERVSGRDLTWFWQPYFFEFGHSEIGIASGSSKQVVINNNGAKPVPIVAEFNYKDGSVETQTVKMSEWISKGTYKLKIPNSSELRYVSINKYIPDVDIEDNMYPPLPEIYKTVDLTGITGKYYLEQYRLDLYLTEVDGVLEMSIPSQGSAENVIPLQTDEFETLDGSFRFIIDRTDGEPTGMTAFYYGNEFSLVKTE